MISVIIATKDRPAQIRTCLLAILQSSFQNFEVLLIDQSIGQETETIVTAMHSPKIIYYHMEQKGKARALNYAIRVASGSILAFTDDDCVVSNNWLQQIYNTFNRRKHISGILGSVLPFQPGKHPSRFCPATFIVEKDIVLSSPDIFPPNGFGIGNNMCFRRSIIDTMGFFSEWLGPGVFHLGGGEEEEYIYRLLRYHILLFQSSSIIVFHDRWLTYEEYRIQQGRYTSGEIAWSLNYAFIGDKRMGHKIYKKICDKFLNEHIRPYLYKLTVLNVRWIIKHRASFVQEVFFSLVEVIFITEGVLIALLHTFFVYMKVRVHE